jgi:hypothetical protein
VLGSADAFGDDEAIFAGAALSPDDAWLMIGDNSMFSGVANRVAVLSVEPQGLTARQVLDVDDPVDLLVSPWGDRAAVLSGYSNAVFEISLQGGQAGPWRLEGEIAYDGASPQLPAAAAMVERGGQRGLVLLTENQGVRRLRFSEGALQDLGLQRFGSGIEAIPGALGVQP